MLFIVINPREIKQAYVERLLSEKQIAEKFRISPNAVRRCLDALEVKRRSRSEALRCVYVTRHGKRKFTLKKRLTPEEEKLKIAGTMLYWGEGSKNGATVTFSNSDPDMVRVFMRFLRVVCGVSEEHLRLTLHYYEDHNSQELIKFWSSITKIPQSQFHTPYLHLRRKSGTYKNLQYMELFRCVITILICSRLLSPG